VTPVRQRQRPGEPVRPEVIRDALHKAMKATNIADPEWLSLHSFRRGWIATSEREGNPTPVSMQITGHEDRVQFDGYQRGHKGDDLLGAVRKVYDARQQYRRSRRSMPTPIGNPHRIA
jgi:integrase